jgi:hypothetical protein
VKPKLKDIAAQIAAHLRRFEADPKINAQPKGRMTRPYYCVNSWAAGPRVFVRYISFQDEFSFTRDEALGYLAWLDAGNAGKHFDVRTLFEKRQEGRDL